MKITIKTIKGDSFQVQCEPQDTVEVLKSKIFEAKQLDIETQKLVFKGQVLNNETKLEDSKIQDNDFLVVMIVKAMQKKEAAPQNVKPVQQPIQQQQSIPIQQEISQQQPQVNFASEFINNDSQMEKTISEIQNMGFERSQVVLALQAAYNNPDRAIEYLINGIPEIPQDMQQHLNPNIQQLPEQQSQNASSQLMMFAQHPQFQQLRATIHQNPLLLQQFLIQLQQSNPEIFQLIQNNEEEFFQLLEMDGVQEGDDGEGIDEEEGDDDQEEDYDEGQVEGPPLELTQDDEPAIERLIGLGFQRNVVVQVFLQCGKDENLTANYLFDIQLNQF